jgi:hypothetical protein
MGMVGRAVVVDVERRYSRNFLDLMILDDLITDRLVEIKIEEEDEGL